MLLLMLVLLIGTLQLLIMMAQKSFLPMNGVAEEELDVEHGILSIGVQMLFMT